ncbi:membrane protein, putative [Babesia bigemina]|uniref:Membrane protein, putative n=1 Tax=Babesia bigemina TaxID=5866 RepID=A0A061D744_BABBI|nr:membrane protein, putative [Babesia bigemina]CDR96536.1 membrane protein, putative [Babesia bigemina]|eukprot:XP_012768722.1 membrane protein, putative [Babesia bigemina]
MGANNSSNRSRPQTHPFGVDLTRCLDSACMTLIMLLVSCAFLFMFGETLRMVERTTYAREEYVRRFLNRLFPFRLNFDFNLTHALLFCICMLLISFRYVQGTLCPDPVLL